MSDPWLLACAALLVPLAVCALGCMRGTAEQRLVALELASVVLSLLLLSFAQALRHAAFFDLAVALALLTFGGSFVFAHFLERWL